MDSSLHDVRPDDQVTDCHALGTQQEAVPSSQPQISTRFSEDQDQDAVMEKSDLPPSYDALAHPAHLRRRFTIQPREDEGRESLPPYSSSISLESVFSRKMELEGAVYRSHDRNWYRVFVTLQGTALTFHKCKGQGVFAKAEAGRKSSLDFPAGTKKGQFLRSYNLQHADVGVAADYMKKKYVIRVRAEADQFLISCLKIETFVLWIQSLFAAIDLALPLDDREIPRDLSIPQPQRRRQGSSHIDRNEDMIRQQQEIMRTQYPTLANTMTEGIPEETIPPVPQDTCPRPSTAPSTPPDLEMLGIPSTNRRPRRNTITPNRPVSTLPQSNPSISPETGKWRPQHQWTPMFDMMYAKRCMAILTSRSPRKTNFVIMKGKQWMIDWRTGALTRCEPPEYGEEDEPANWKLGPYGTMIRV
ncbi:hypothetical protein B7494_g6778 [Chlorociboria aeruginascens]|nr:hypothetical protein B7494_g6778 [Chlorociboria aeruginascens]